MRLEIYNWFLSAFDKAEFEGKTVLEVGSLNVNGTLGLIVKKFSPKVYIGIDSQKGNGVDRIISLEDFAKEKQVFDAVICTEVMEHVEDWRTFVDCLKDTVKPKGVLYFSVPTVGLDYHGFPEDHWRFTADEIRDVFQDFELVDMARISMGVCVKLRKPAKYKKFTPRIIPRVVHKATLKLLIKPMVPPVLWQRTRMALNRKN